MKNSSHRVIYFFFSEHFLHKNMMQLSLITSWHNQKEIDGIFMACFLAVWAMFPSCSSCLGKLTLLKLLMGLLINLSIV